MKRFKRHFMWLALLIPLAGCSPDVVEVSDIALVMISAIDYEERTNQYIYTLYCIHASTNSTQDSERVLEWVASAQGKSVYDAARNLRSRAGKSLIFQHDKVFLVGESAARHSIYEIMDFMTRSREFRTTSYLLITEGDASEKVRMKSETGDLVANELLGKIRNERVWGKSLSLTIKDVANYYTSPYRGFVTGRISKSMPVNGSREVLFLSGGSVFNQGKLVGWLAGKDVLAIHMITLKKEWRNLEFAENIPYKTANVIVMMNVADRSLRFDRQNGKPGFEVRIKLRGTIKGMSDPHNMVEPEMLAQLEQAAGTHIEGQLKASLALFQRQMKVDVIGFSDYLRKYHPQEWKQMEKRWVSSIYPELPIRIHVEVVIPEVGLSGVLGGS